MKTLNELHNLYSNQEILIACYNEKYNNVIMPKTVSIKSDLTVWHNGSCIINGMKDQLFLHGDIKHKTLKDDLFKIIDSKDFLSDKQKSDLKVKRKNKKL